MSTRTAKGLFRVDRKSAVLAAAVSSALALTGRAHGGTTPGEVTISTAGSTALKNWFVANTNTFTDVQPGTQITIGGVQYPSTTAEWAVNGGPAYGYQLAPKQSNTGTVTGQVVDQSAAVRFEFHESGSVEGLLEMANDQISPVTYVTQNVDRNPTSGIGNAVWVNYNQFGGSNSALAFNAASGGGDSSSTASQNYHLGNFYNGSSTFVLGGSAQPAFNLSGGNLNGGQNAVQVAVSDAIPLQVFQQSAGTDSHAATPWMRTPSDLNYGTGNPNLVTGSLGTANSRAQYQTTASLNMPAGAINPRTGTAFGAGPWNSAGLNNLNTQVVAITATMFVANPGTGLAQVNRTDAQWLQTTGRLKNGAMFNVAARDVNSGTRNVAALETGLDPTWTSGANDNGNGNGPDGAGPAVTGDTSAQIYIGPKLRFSNKTAGGNEMRPTVQVNRMAVGTLSINDADGSNRTNNGGADPVRALAYSDSPDGSAPYVLANFYTISKTANSTYNPGGTQQYSIFQNEQFVTVKTPDATYNTSSQNIQGDNSTGDVKSLLNNTLNSVTSFYTSGTGTLNAVSPAAGLQTQGYILPQLMQVRKDMNGIGTIVPNDTAHGATGLTAYNASATPLSSLVAAMNTGSPSTVTTGTSSVYGGSSARATAAGFVDQIPITSTNYLFGNFNQNGVRDYDAAVVQAQKAQAALLASAAGTSALSGSSNGTPVTTGIPALDAKGPTKGDLIVLGDYNGDGKFDGLDLYYMATGASLTDAASRPSESGTSFTTGTINPASNFSTAIMTSVLNKNVAMDYLRANATAQQKVDAAATLLLPAGVTTIPAGATAAGTDAVSGQTRFTFDSAGVNAFNKTDVNRDGVVDFNDSVLVDGSAGKDFTSLSDTLTATMPAPYTGTTVPANLVLVSQIDGSTVIGSADLAVANSAMTGAGTTNWYGYGLNKTGAGTITWGRTGGTVTVFGGASLNISAGAVQVASAVDPFTDSSVTTPTDTTRSVAITVNGGTLQYNASGTGIVLDRLSSLNVSTGGAVTLVAAANHANRTVLEVGSLTLAGGSIDLGNNDMIVRSGSLPAVTAAVVAGLHGSAGIGSSLLATDSTHTMTIAVALNGNLFNGTSTFDGVAPAAGDVLVKYTYFGDANFDGKVDGADYSRIDNGYLTGATGWTNGDFNYDGTVDGSDYSLIDNAYNRQGAALSSAALVASPASLTAAPSLTAGVASAVPEPTSLGLAGLAAAGLLARRRRA